MHAGVWGGPRIPCTFEYAIFSKVQETFGPLCTIMQVRFTYVVMNSLVSRRDSEATLVLSPSNRISSPEYVAMSYSSVILAMFNA